MHKIEELINKLCPNGIEKLLMKEVANVSIGEFVHKNKQNDSFPYPVYNGGISNTGYYKEYNNEGKKVLISARGANAGFVNKIDGRYWAGNSCYSISVKDETKLDWNYLYYYMKNNESKLLDKQQTGSIPSISKKQIEEFKVFVPPLEVQNEIVRILDELTIKSEKLNQNLNKELVLRQKQYKYYKEKIICKDINIKWVPLLNVANTYTGLTYKPSDVSSDGTLVLRSSNIQNNKLCFDDNVFVSIDNIPERAIVKENDILICVRNGSKALIGKSAIITKHDKKMAFGAFMTILRATDEINSRYLLHVWQSSLIQDMIHNDSGMPINQITKKMLEKMKIPVPKKEEQEKIADTLDKFDAIFSEILDKINYEIDSQQKQYEYYRYKLLTFKELKVNE